MNNYAGNHFDEEIQTRQAIHGKFKKIWEQAEALGKEVRAKLGGSHPITKEIDFACIHLLNGEVGVKENLYVALPRCNKIKPNTLRQCFVELDYIWWSGAKTRSEIRTAYNTGARMSARSDGKEGGTIKDIAVRRLGLAGQTDEFVGLVEAWVNGDASGLVWVLKRHTDASLHESIEAYFREKKFCN